MVRDLLVGKTSLQISHLITDLLCPSKQIAQWVTSHWSPQQLNSIPFIRMHKGIQLWEVQY